MPFLDLIGWVYFFFLFPRESSSICQLLTWSWFLTTTAWWLCHTSLSTPASRAPSTPLSPPSRSAGNLRRFYSPFVNKNMNMIVISGQLHDLEALGLSPSSLAFQMFPGLKYAEAGFPAFWYTSCTQSQFLCSTISGCILCNCHRHVRENKIIKRD